MNPVQIVAGVIAGAIGAAVWAAIAYYAEVEIGYIAWGIGILVGVAVAATGQNSALAGVAAVVITVLSLVAGKYAAVELAVQDLQAEMEGMTAEWSDPDADVDDEALQSFLANQIAEQREAAGEEIQWPEVSDDEESVAASYPPDIWKEAGGELSSKSDEEKAQLREQYVANAKQLAEMLGQAIANSVREEGFFASFGTLDFVFFGLAIVTAWGIASREE